MPHLRAQLRAPGDRALVVAAVILGVALIAVAVLYWVEPARSLPSFTPGHETGSDHHHMKHGIAALLLGAGCLVYAWFQTGPNKPPRLG
jgi:hypothetical protein